jgi:ABC-type transport system substrate-binding protein
MRRRKNVTSRRFVLGLMMAAATVAAAAAHHSVPGQFDTSKPTTLTGVISDIDWVNPHIYIHLDVKEADGTVNKWSLGSAPPAMLRKANLTKAKLMGAGEVVSIVVYPARDGTKNLGWLTKITYPDGRVLTLDGR